MSVNQQENNQQQNPQSSNQQQAHTRKGGKKGLIIFVTLFLVVSVGAATFFGFKCFEFKEQINTLSTELGKYQFAVLPNIEKNASISTADQYYDFIAGEDFVSKYNLRLNPDVPLNFRDFTSTTSEIVTAGQYGATFPIAYIEKASSGKYHIYFAVPCTDVITGTLTTRIAYVTLDDISAKLPSAATGEFVKVTP